MTTKTFLTVSSTLFFVIAFLHLVRLIQGWPALVNGWNVPLWVSWIAVIVAGYLAYQGKKLLQRP